MSTPQSVGLIVHPLSNVLNVALRSKIPLITILAHLNPCEGSCVFVDVHAGGM